MVQPIEPVSMDGFSYCGRDAIYVELPGGHKHSRASPGDIRLVLDRNSTPAQSLPGHWYTAQLLHYGFKPVSTTTKPIMRKLLSDAIDAGKLVVPKRIADVEVELKRLWKDVLRRREEDAEAAKERVRLLEAVTEGLITNPGPKPGGSKPYNYKLTNPLAGDVPGALLTNGLTKPYTPQAPPSPESTRSRSSAPMLIPPTSGATPLASDMYAEISISPSSPYQKRRRGSNVSTSSYESARIEVRRRAEKACEHCIEVKRKCIFTAPTGPCVRCEHVGVTCILRPNPESPPLAMRPSLRVRRSRGACTQCSKGKRRCELLGGIGPCLRCREMDWTCELPPRATMDGHGQPHLPQESSEEPMDSVNGNGDWDGDEFGNAPGPFQAVWSPELRPQLERERVTLPSLASLDILDRRVERRGNGPANKMELAPLSGGERGAVLWSSATAHVQTGSVVKFARGSLQTQNGTGMLG